MNENGKAASIAKAAGQKRYLGTICLKHPELSGERNARNRGCIGCNKDKMRVRRAANPEYHRRATRVAYEKWYKKNRLEILAKTRHRRTGIDPATYEAMWKAQDGKCPLCSNSLVGRRPHADHCHESGIGRGILCGTCNQAEGLIRRSGLSMEEFVRNLADYLKNPTSKKLSQ